MIELNNNEILAPWSLRDISKLFARIKKQSKMEKNYENLGLFEHILFYILSSISDDDNLIDKRINDVIEIIKKAFQINDKKEDDVKKIKGLRKLYKENANLTPREEKQSFYLQKGDVSIFYCKYDQNHDKNMI